MTILYADIERLEDTTANLSGRLIDNQLGFETDLNKRMGRKYDDGTVQYFPNATHNHHTLVSSDTLIDPALQMNADGEAILNVIHACPTNEDKFLVSSGGAVQYRTSAQVLSDIGASSTISGTANYLVKFSSTHSGVNSTITDDSALITLGSPTNVAYVNTVGANAAIRMSNSSATGQTSIEAYTNSVVRGRIRYDFVGNAVYISNGGGHEWYTGGDAGVGTKQASIGTGGLFAINKNMTTVADVTIFDKMAVYPQDEGGTDHDSTLLLMGGEPDLEADGNVSGTYGDWITKGDFLYLPGANNDGAYRLSAHGNIIAEIGGTTSSQFQINNGADAITLQSFADGRCNLGHIGSGNYVAIASDGILTLEGDAVTWDDLRFPATTIRQGATNKPEFDTDDVGLLFPNNDTAEIAYMNVQIPHKWKLESDLEPHIHYIQNVAEDPIFKMDYRWYKNGQPSGEFSTITASGKLFTYTGDTILQIMEFPTISGAGIDTVSSMMDIKLYRDDAAVTGTVLMKEFDIHYMIDSFGSEQEFSK